MVQLPNFSERNVKSPLSRFQVALVIFVYLGISSCGVSSAKIPLEQPSLTPLLETLISKGNDTEDALSMGESFKIIPDPQKPGGQRSPRVGGTSGLSNTSWWWSICVLGPVAAICLVPFVWYYVLPKLRPVAWNVFMWGCTLVGFSAALAIIYLAVIAAFDYLGTGVDVTVNSLSDGLGEFSQNLPTPQGLAALTTLLIVFVVLLWCLPLVCNKLSALTKTRAGVPSIRIAPASPTSNDIFGGLGWGDAQGCYRIGRHG